MMKENVKENIENRIKKKGRGLLYVNSDFADLGSPDAVRQALQRIQKEGMIIRIFRGIYSYPKIDTKLGLGIISPSMWDIANAMARRDNAKIIPTASFALNQLGLSTQVPANAVFYTSGSSRRVKIGSGRGIMFIHTSDNKMLSFKSYLMLLITLSMREIGEEYLNDKHLDIIRGFLSHVTKTDYNHDIKLMPIWIQQKLYSI